MSSKEQKQQLLSQKLFRNLKSKKLTVKDDRDDKPETSKKSKSTAVAGSSSKKESETGLTK